MILAIQPASAFESGKVGAFADLPFDIYKAAEGVNKSGLTTMRDNPRRYHLELTGQIPPSPTAAMEYGTMIHDQILFGRAAYHVQPETYGEEAKKWNGNAKECRLWKAEHADLPIISRDKERQLRFEADAVLEDPFAAALLKGQQSELSIFARHPETGYLLKGRLDHYGEDASGPYFLDIKTTIDASTRSLSKEILNRRYHVQFAMYRLILRALGVPDLRIYIIALEKGDIPRVNVRKISEEALEIGETSFESDLKTLQQFRRLDWWPDFSDAEYQPHTIPSITLPDYALGDTETLTGMTTAAA